MRLTCPACHAEMSLDAAVGREADARAMADFIERNVPLGGLLIRYIALFRPAKRRLSLARTVALFDELLPDLQRQAITRKGRDWAAPLALWRLAIEQVLAARDKGTLTLPLTSHGYLLEVLVGHADKAEGLAEREREAATRGRAHTGGPVPIALGLGDITGTGANQMPDGNGSTALPPPYDMTKGPSRAAKEFKARLAASQAARGAAQPDTPEGTES